MSKSPQKPQLCNVLDITSEGQRLWHFNNPSATSPAQSVALATGSKLPSKLISRGWTSLLKPSANVSWLPADQIFLKVVELPAADVTELASMLEFQVEKLSPLPIGQAVWSFESIPHADGTGSTVILVIANRAQVEAQIGVLEKAGFQPDRIEVPMLHALLSSQPQGSVVRVHLGSGDERHLCLTSWWIDGRLMHLQLIHLPAANRGPALVESLTKTVWAGEMEGWLQLPVPCELVAEDDHASVLKPLLEEWAGAAVTILPPASRESLAAFGATRVLKGASPANLVPPEFTSRFRQEFVDRLWMRGLAALVVLYAIGVAGYFVALSVLKVKQAAVESESKALSGSYTNALQLRERVLILQDQLNLKYAALDSFKAASDLLPEDLTLNWLIFGRGSSLELHGTAPADMANKLADYNDALRNAMVGDKPLFKSVSPPTSSTRQGQQLGWVFTCELAQTEVE